MRLLVTAGNTQTPVDAVRCITNIFTGRTGANIASAAATRGHDVHLLTSHPEVVPIPPAGQGKGNLRVETYRTFDDLAEILAARVRHGGYDVIVHAAAVSDYAVAGVFSCDPGKFDPSNQVWAAGATLRDAQQGKVKGNHPELWLRMVPTPKLIDQMRAAWGFTGYLVKFKLEVGMAEAELAIQAEAARKHSRADLIVANTFEGKEEWALLGPHEGKYHRIERSCLAVRLLEVIEQNLS